MKLFFTIITLLTWGLQAQNNTWIEVAYTVEIDFGIPSITNSKLVFSNSEAYYKEGQRLPKASAQTGKTINVKNSDEADSGELFVTSLKEKKLFTKSKIENSFYQAEENLFPIDWKIDKNSKAIILGYQCFKATGIFRGRQYTAWFTEEIPVKFGPWKLNGLPGLILEVSDTMGQVVFVAQRIEKLKSFAPATFDYTKNQSDYKKISLKEYIKIRKENDSKIFHSVIAKLPREAKIIEIKENDKPTGYELKYEWEK
ncbi:GLPGLI family protein [Capnocytophaga stomatis]|uniref:GLPGLI family protein n=1 Tax=Capnocytophaga stomatis TaxID=1848904 RepID=UPI001ACD1C9D|nr:GLPGLI family protein [Capnocytophaga stomatis]GIM49793.1 hypothetical protein CAPN003_12450 [Capnocytophaga stomatis]